MTLLNEAVEAKKFDTRMIERNIARGVIAAQDADQVSKNLPDDGEGADWVSIDSLMNDQQGSSGMGETSHS